MNLKENTNKYGQLEDESVKIFNKILNTVLKQKYYWFKSIDIKILFIYNWQGGILATAGDIYIDSEWAHNQWRDYNYPKKFPQFKEVSFGEIVGGEESEKLKKDFFDVLFFITGFSAKNLSFSNIIVHLIDTEDVDLQEQVLRIQKIMGTN